MPHLKLTEIWIYPIKSLGGISLSSAQVTGKGLLHDRRRMLVDETNTAMTQRDYPKMALLKSSISNGRLNIQYGKNALSIDLAENNNTNPFHVNIWRDKVDAYEVSERHSQWFSDILETRCKLVFFPEENPRPVDPRYKVNDEHVSLADAYPFLIIGESSLNDLNARLAEPVPMNRFRPNFVFEGGTPYEEDSWKKFAIGKTRFAGVKPSDRCVLTTVNQSTGEKGTEPLKTLATYRKRENKIYFGQNLVALENGFVNVGDAIIVEEKI